MSKHNNSKWCRSASDDSDDDDNENDKNRKDHQTKRPDKVSTFQCKNARCDQDIVCVGGKDYFCSRECYQVKQDMDALGYKNNGVISKHITLRGRGGTGLLADSESLDHLMIEVNSQFGRVVTVDKSGPRIAKWRKLLSAEQSETDKVNTNGTNGITGLKEEERKQKLEEKIRLKALLNIDFEDSSSEEEEDSQENEHDEEAEAQEEIQTLLSSGVHSNICPLHPPIMVPVLDRGKCLIAYTINIVNPWEIHLQTVEMIKQTEKINSILNRPEGIDPRMILKDWSPKIGGYCCAKYLDKYYRAKVIIQSGDSFQVKYIDFGNVDLVQRENVRQLNPEVSLIPRQCIYFKISNVKPKNGEKRWSNEVCSFSIEHLDGAAVELELDAVEQQIIHVGKLRVLQSISGKFLGDFGNTLVEQNLAEPDYYFLP